MNSIQVNRNQLIFIVSCSAVIGSLPSPVDCYLVLRGLKTLHLRMEKHMQNATEVAQFLETHPNVERVFYPGIEYSILLVSKNTL